VSQTPSQENDVGAIAPFALDVPLIPGIDNELTVVVMDTAENLSAPMRLTVQRDFTPPPPPSLFTTEIVSRLWVGTTGC
jgi:hypothetical protein